MADRPSHLRVAGPDEKVQPKAKPKNITESLDGTSRDVLAAMRESLAKQLDAGKIAGNSIASAYRELRELDRLIRVSDEADAAEGRPDGDVDDTFDASAV